jgi:hypothetical protein
MAHSPPERSRKRLLRRGATHFEMFKMCPVSPHPLHQRLLIQEECVTPLYDVDGL